MLPTEQKLARLVKVSKMYYMDNLTQAEIAGEFRVSRPMVSKLLAEARDLGIVTIRIRETTDYRQVMAEKIMEEYPVKNVFVIPMKRDRERTDSAVVIAACRVLEEKAKENMSMGISWGSLMGKMIDYLEESREEIHWSGKVCPLIGSAAASSRSYHTNELVRIFAQKTGLEPTYIYAPAISESQAEKEIYEKTDSFGQIREMWGELDLALVNISNYPSSPDMATAFRFGGKLAQKGAAGHMISHFYDREGAFIQEENDCTLHISTETLAAVGDVVGMCSSAVNPISAIGALKTGLISDFILNEELAAAISEQI